MNIRCSKAFISLLIPAIITGAPIDSYGQKWSATSDCSSCHSKYAAKMNEAGTLGSAHVRSGVGNCNTCHDDESFLAKAHEGADPTQAITRVRRYPQQFCLRCHGTYANLAKRTQNSTRLKDLKGIVVNPHALPNIPAHAKVTECSTCHKVHKTPFDPMVPCRGCHHKDVFGCKTCHDSPPRK